MLTVCAPAKLNLYLRILGRRPDGFHELETLFERIDLADELTFEPAPRDIRLTCDHPDLETGPANLIVRAAHLLKEATRIEQGVFIHLSKRIPIASGMGGGSSDAAATLLALNELWRAGLTREQLGELGAQLGSDVPFFIGPESFAVGRGRGERCEPVADQDSFARLWHVLVVPNVRLSTKEIYEGFAEARRRAATALTPDGPSIRMCLHALRNGSLGELARGLFNDLQPEAIRRCPVIQEIHTQLRDSGCVGVLTSGSGPSVFGLCRDASHAESIRQRLDTLASARDSRRHGVSGHWFTRVVSTFNRSSSRTACVAS